jgi:hypothetical protein
MAYLIRKRMIVALFSLAAVVGLPGMAQAHENASEDTTENTTTAAPATETVAPEHTATEVLSTLPVLGAGLNVTIERDESGSITSVALDPSDGVTTVKETDHKVVFLLGDGTTEVVVKSHGKSVETKIKAESTEAISGDGAWSADVFGNGLVTIPYTLSFTDNVPGIAVGSIVLPDGVTAEIGDPKVKTSDDAMKSFAKVKVALTSGDEVAKVSLVASTYVDEDGATKVRFSASLSARDWSKCHGRHDEDGRRDDNDGGKSNWNRHDENGSRHGDRDHDGDHDGRGHDDDGES